MLDKRFDLEALRKELYSGLICDVLDQLGYRNQSFSSAFETVQPDTVVFGYAYTVYAERVDEMPADALVNQCRSIEGIKQDEVYLLATKDGDFSGAVWGEIMSTGVRARGGVGAIIHGKYRDTRQVKAMGFPLIACGHLPTTSKGRTEIIKWQIPVEIDGVTIQPGDLVFGDIDGVVVIPAQVQNQVLDRCLEIMASEDVVRTRIENGDSVVETYMQIGAI